MMKNDKELVNIFDECLERILTGGESIEQCLASYPERAAELEPLLQTALSAKATLDIAPSFGFRERARNQILTELRDIAERKQRRFSLFGWQPRWATVAISVMILLIASSGTVAAAGNSMPDQPLYPVKLAAENVRLTLIRSKLGKAEYYAELVDRRVGEIVSMAEKGKLKQAEKATERMNNQLMAMTVLVSTEEGVAGVLTTAPAVPEAVPAPEEATAEAPMMLVAPEEPAPEAVTALPPPEITVPAPAPPQMKAGEPQKGKPEITAAPVRPEPEKAPVLAPAPAAVPGPEAEVEKEEADETLDKRARLRLILIRNAIKHPEALRAALQRAPESARPALLRALEASNIEYEKLLEFLEQAEDGEESEGED